MSRGHFYPLPPTFIGGRQPYAPQLGQPQSGPVSSTPPPMSRVNFDAIVRAEFYPPPPTFIGGAQPYGPRLGLPQSGPIPDNPPRRSSVTFDIIRASWVARPYALPSAAEIAPLIPVAASSDPPPLNRQWFDVVHAAHRNSPWTLIYVTSIAPILSIPEVVDNPPPRTMAGLLSIIRQWDQAPNRPPQLKGTGAFSIAVTPDNPPPSSSANLNLIRSQWEPRKWWPLPDLDGIAAYTVAATPDAPPPSSGVNLRIVVDSWRPANFIAQGYGDQAALLTADVSLPPPINRAAMRVVIDTWKGQPFDVTMTLNAGQVGGSVDADRIVIDVNSSYIPIKDPDDDLLLTFDWSDELTGGASLSSVVHTAPLPLVASNELTDSVGGTSQVDIAGGVHGGLYILEIVATLSDASTVTRSWPVRGFNS